MTLWAIYDSVQIANYADGDSSISEIDRDLIGTNAVPTHVAIETISSKDADAKSRICSCLVLEVSDLSSEEVEDIISLTAEPGFANDSNRVMIFKLRLLKKLAISADLSTSEHLASLITLMVYYGYEHMSWSNPTLAKLANNVLNSIAKQNDSEVERSLIRCTKPKAIELTRLNNTNSISNRLKFRNSINLKMGFLFNKNSAELNTWKLQNIKLISVLKKLIEINCQELSLIVPLLLFFLDDHEIAIKAEACHLLHDLLLSYKPTNYMQIFKTSTEKCLMCLPNLTPADQSLQLLPIAYDTMFLLVQDDEQQILNLVQDHIITSLMQVQDKSFEVLEFLLNLLATKVIDSLRLQLIAVLPQLIPQILTIMTDPYIAQRGSCVSLVLGISLKICQYCWPVMQKYQYDYLAAIVILAKSLKSSEIKKCNADVQDRLKNLCLVLDRCTSKFLERLQKLATNEPVLADMF